MKRASLSATTLALVATVAFFAPVARAHDPKCGDIVRTSITLSDNIGPCAGDGLILGAEGVTVNLNGRSILGMPGNTGVGIRAEFPGAAIYGNTPGYENDNNRGRIDGFGVGVQVGLYRIGSATVQHLTLANNRFGIYVIQAGTAKGIHLRGNVISNGDTGIRVAESSDVKIKENTISGQSRVGIALVGVTRITVIRNILLNNYEGLVGDSIHLGFSAVRIAVNRFEKNTTNGLRIQGNFAGPGIELLSNTATGNFQDGFVLPYRGSRTEDNVATENTRYGLFVEGERQRVIENRASGNGAGDVFFNNINAPDVCFKYNQFTVVRAATPAGLTLPVCP